MPKYVCSRSTAAIVAASLFVVGCNEDSIRRLSEPTQKQASATPQLQPKQAFDALLNPFYDYVKKADSTTIIPATFGDDLRKQLGELIKKYNGDEAGQRAMRESQNNLEESLVVARDATNPPLVLLLCQLVEQLDPEDKRIDRFRFWATTLQNRPIVIIRGWYQPLDTEKEIIYVFLKVYLPNTQEVKSVRVREGEEFDGVKFVKVLGKKSGIELEYKATGDVFDVYGP